MRPILRKANVIGKMNLNMRNCGITMINLKCDKCGSNFEQRDNRKYGILIIIGSIIFLSIIFALAYATVIPYIFIVVSLSIGFYRIFLRNRFFYIVKNVVIKNLENRGQIYFLMAVQAV
jgi:hypothetical protein